MNAEIFLLMRLIKRMRNYYSCVYTNGKKASVSLAISNIGGPWEEIKCLPEWTAANGLFV